MLVVQPAPHPLLEVALGVLGVFFAAAARAHTARRRGRRQPELDRDRRAHHPALRVREARASCWIGTILAEGAARPWKGSCRPARRGWRHPARAARWRPRNGHHHARVVFGALYFAGVRLRTGLAVPLIRRARSSPWSSPSRARAAPAHGCPAAPTPADYRAPAGSRTASGRWRTAACRRRHRQLHLQVVLAARGGQRLHLRDDRRGARARRRDRGAGAVRRDGRRLVRIIRLAKDLFTRSPPATSWSGWSGRPS